MGYKKEKLIQLLLAGKAGAVSQMVQEGLDEGILAEEIVSQGLLAAMEKVEKKFEQNEVYVTELLVTARAINAGVRILGDRLQQGDMPYSGRVLIGTVSGDIHDIGKNLLKSLLQITGIEVIDLGVDVSSSKFVEAVARYKPEVLCMSALLTTTVSGLEENISALEEAGLRNQLKVVVGGSVVNEALAKKIGSDYYFSNVVSGAGQIKKLIVSMRQKKKIENNGDFFFSEKEVQEMQELFFNFTGGYLTVVDKNGELISSKGAFNACSEYCRAMEKILSNENKVKTVALPPSHYLENVYVYRCPADMIEITYPLISEEGQLGSIICGHFLFQEDKESVEKKVVPVISYNGLVKACHLVSYLGRRIMASANFAQRENEFLKQQSGYIHLLKKQNEMEKALQTADLKALQSQVNPHFMFNALNTVARMALLDGNHRIEKITGALARLMRYTLYQVDAQVRVRSEVQAVEDYLIIQEARFSGRISSKIEVEPGILDEMMPCMILQPLVENACLHGLEPSKEGGLVQIKGWQKNERVFFEIADNGIGIEKKVKDSIFQMKNGIKKKGEVSGIGIDNVVKRLQHHYGGESGFDIESELGVGTIIRISFPQKNEV